MFDTIKDISNLKMLEAIIETSYDGIYITDGQANTILVNSSYERITGLKKEQVVGNNMEELVKKGMISESATLNVLKRREPVTINQKFNTGKSALVTGTPFFSDDGIIKMVVTNVRDITDLEILKKQYNESKSENIKYQSIIEELKNQIIGSDFIIAEDEEMLNLLSVAKRVAKFDTNVIIYGETGSGKEVVAKFIYNNSQRKDKPFVKINCGAIPESLIESEFFGYAEGAFTGASKGGKIGIFEAADNGTLMLDEIGEIPLSMQVKLLRVLQDGEIEKVGSNKTIKVNVRIIALTNKNLYKMVEDGTFREDLFYRLNIVPLTVPPLRKRRSSIIPTVEYYLNVYNEKYSLSKTLSDEVLKYLYEYSWAGNVRELKNLVERIIITSVKSEVEVENLPSAIVESVDAHDGKNIKIEKLSEAVNLLEKDMIFKAYERHGNVRDAAKELGIDPSTFVRKRKKYIK